MEVVHEELARPAPAEIPRDISQIEDLFTEYLEKSTSAKEEMRNIISANGETFFINLEDVRYNSMELYEGLHRYFSTRFEKLRTLFKSYSLRTVNRALDLSFYNPSRRLRLRDMRSESLQHLISFTGTATRSSQVRPELTVGTFTCRDCGTKIGGIKQEHKYTPPVFCPNELCTNRSKFDVDLSESSFTNWQRINVQENTDEIPHGSLPRMIDVIVRNEMIEKIKPGTRLRFTGYAAVIPTGPALVGTKAVPVLEGVSQDKVKRNTRDLSYKICFFCIHAQEEKQKTEMTVDEQQLIERMHSTSSLYEKLADSLFPTIHGHGNIKAAILLMLVGGVAKSREVKLRGDINVLLVGDPGTAKSQFLKQTAAVHPCSVYTSGKSSSAAGLTAAAVRDAETGEFTIEAGALMLADTGICCIDEFDKMTYKDQVSIHEAMEQQTITVAKAGITATLNSRTSILAAANPIHGRYDKKKTLRQNVNLSAPIMSRFDLYFVLIDEVNPEHDKDISMKILDNHRRYGGGEIEAPTKFFTVEEVMCYVRHAKDRCPRLEKAGMDVLVEKYTALRQDSLVNSGNYRMTARHLESLVRLSEALAKIHNDPIVSVAYVQEAFRLLKSSVVEVGGGDINLACKEDDETCLVTTKDYSRLLNSLVYLSKTYRLGRVDLVEKYLEYVEESIPSTDALAIERSKCERAIEFFVTSEGVLYEQEGIIYVHPNYDN